MYGWILYRYPQHLLHPEIYGIHRLVETAKSLNIDIQVVSPQDIDLLLSSGAQRTKYFLNHREIPRPDFVLSRMGSATTEYALAAMRQLEQAGILVINSASQVAMASDKFQALQRLALAQLPIPKSMLAKYPMDLDRVEQEFGFPVIVKTLAGSQGRGVFLCENRLKFEDLIAMIATSKGHPHFVIQEFMADSYGRDLRVFVIGGRVVGCMQRTATPGSFKANYSRGASVSVYPMNEVIHHLAIKAAETLQLDIAGVDLLFHANSFVVCEVNSSPGFKGMEESTGINIPKEVFSYILSRLKQESLPLTPQTVI